ncbi:cytochrome p450 [Colletotrichum truncatum]|uniref:Cytochrome p450 n=1 Tax=Colletotrichum truncatum TaxID=5467 RepID=A0ACC3YWX1_COLTU|nr:cytochrome p450 [Colletotrichum truncatum]KAF6791318.1 cytochrome p450 [Colletotrichum truncatum]
MNDLLLARVANLGGSTSVSCGAAAAVGLLSHWLYFIRGPRVLASTRILIFYLVALASLFTKAVSNQGLYDGLLTYVTISGSYFIALFTSMEIYRLCFHPLRRFPGPIQANIANGYIAWLNRNWKIHDRYVEMHEKYGDFVRVGPNAISVVNLDAFNKIHGPQAKSSKRGSGFYDSLVSFGERNLDVILDNDEHRDRRKIWDLALGTKALEKYEVETRAVLRTWLGRLEEVNGKPIDTSHYAKLIPFDNMGRIAFSRDFGSVQEGRAGRILDIIGAAFKLNSRMGQTPWPYVILSSLPRVGKLKEFETLGVRLVDERVAKDSEETHDMMKYFLNDLRSEKPKSFYNMNIIYSDSYAILIGATDTISCVLGYSFYFMAKDAKLRQRLHNEIASARGKTIPGEFAASDLAKLEFLEAFIKETIRMHTPAALNGARVSPPEGVVVDGTYIPGGVTLITPLHLYHRSEKYWKQPHEFIPERWTTRPDLILDQRAYVPFNYGRFDCVGRRLAYNVIRQTIAYTLWNYDFTFAPGEDGTRLEREAKFHLIIKPGRLDCVFTKRPEAEA